MLCRSSFIMLASHGVDPATIVQRPVGIFAVLIAVILGVRRLETTSAGRRIFQFVPTLVFFYFAPTVLNLCGVIPRDSPLYDWTKTYVLPASLILLTLSLDVPGLVRLGPRAIFVFLASSISILIGGPIALAIWKSQLPADAWKPLAYLAGSWIGGAANAVAAKESVGATNESISPVIIVDVVIAYSWMGVLMALAARHVQVDRWLRADTRRMAIPAAPELAQVTSRNPDSRFLGWLLLAACSLLAAYLCHRGAQLCTRTTIAAITQTWLSVDAWRVVFATAFGVGLSFTGARHLETRGSSTVGMWMLYLLVTCIGAGADFSRLRLAGPYLGLGATWMLVHIVLLLIVGRLLRAPFFFLAVSSQANIGGPVSAPIVAAAFHPSLAPVGVLLAIAGYAIGTFGALLCARLCQWVAEGH